MENDNQLLLQGAGGVLECTVHSQIVCSYKKSTRNDSIGFTLQDIFEFEAKGSPKNPHNNEELLRDL